ncbi:restriction endonuclease subunit S [Methylomonas sp. HYX-M1]|uniref:restriction endonuclease subunit S n=1 Tax=Methylomonas sp. HYX-M1 TaxID=3139307 RepID=UPI00345BFFB6
MEQGDILYGSRRTYLRKVAVAHFDGITSNTTFVIKANEAKIDKRLLPFVMLSEGFAEHSIRNSKGSVNPYINWKDIANYEFLLPPKNQQAKLAELLWAMDEVIEKHLDSLRCSELLIQSNENLLLNKSDYVTKNILDVAEVQRGKFAHRPRNAPQFYGGNIPFIQTAEVVEANKWIKKYSQTLNEIGLSISKMFKRKTIVMTIAANIGYVGMLDFDSAFTDSLVGINSFEDILSQEYLFYYLNHKQKEIESLSTESAQKNLSLERFESFKVNFPESLSEQLRIVAILDNIRNNMEVIELNVLASTSLQKSLINQIF